MDAFDWISIPISLFLGLAIAEVVAGYVRSFKTKSRLRLDWLPLVFAGAILGEALQFWWALFELSTSENVSLATFTLLVMMVMALYTAAALIAPTEADVEMRVAFERDGRWALVALACFHLLAIIGNWLLWSVPLYSRLQGLLMVLGALCLLAGLTQRRRLQEVAAVA